MPRFAPTGTGQRWGGGGRAGRCRRRGAGSGQRAWGGAGTGGGGLMGLRALPCGRRAAPGPRPAPRRRVGLCGALWGRGALPPPAVAGPAGRGPFVWGFAFPAGVGKRWFGGGGLCWVRCLKELFFFSRAAEDGCEERGGGGNKAASPSSCPASTERTASLWGELCGWGALCGKQNPPQPPPPTPVLGCGERSRALSPRGERCAAGGELGVGGRRVVRAATSHVVCASEVKP